MEDKIEWSLAKLDATSLVVFADATVDLNGLNSWLHHFVHYIDPERPPGVQLHRCAPLPPGVDNAGILACLPPLLYRAPADYGLWSTSKNREAILHHIIRFLREHHNAFVGYVPPPPLPPE